MGKLKMSSIFKNWKSRFNFQRWNRKAREKEDLNGINLKNGKNEKIINRKKERNNNKDDSSESKQSKEQAKITALKQ